MKRFLLFCFALFLFSQLAAQNSAPVPPLPLSMTNSGYPGNLPSGKGELAQPNKSEYIVPKGKDFNFQIRPFGVLNKQNPEVDSLKAIQNPIRLNGESKGIFDESKGQLHPVSLSEPANSDNTKAIDIKIETNFGGYDDGFFFPNDNDIAVGNNGYIVSVCNSHIDVYDQFGTNHYSNSLHAFLGSNTNFSGYEFDPRVVYDSQSDRFIMVCLDGNGAASSKVIVAFSNSNNPAGSWTYYWYAASGFSTNYWFDYPSIGVNDDYLFVTGNLYTNNGANGGSVVMRFDKSLGYNAQQMGYTYWTNPQDDQGATGFTIFPLTYGLQGAYGPSGLFVSTFAGSGSVYQFWVLDNTTDNLSGYQVSSYNYQIGSDAAQSGSVNLLDVGDCRVKSAYYLYDASSNTGWTHFSYTSTFAGSGTRNGAVRAWIKWDNNGMSSDGIAKGSSYGDYAHSSIAAFGTNGGSKRAVLCASYVSSTTYPTSAVFGCDDAMQLSQSYAMKFGSNYIHDYDFNKQKCRWGDYTGIQLKYNSSPVAAWAAASYGSSTSAAGTWISEVTEKSQAINLQDSSVYNSAIYPNPVSSNFTMSFTLTNSEDITIDIINQEGKLITTLFHDQLPAGEKKIRFNRNALASGIYFIRISNNERVLESKKLIIH